MKKSNSMHSEQGSALFLILIAVALFAALSYAVTQSGRGGGSIDREQLQLDIAEFMGHVSLIEQHITRLYIMGYVDQVRFDSSAYNASGTVYAANGATSTGRTVGVFNIDEGIRPLVHQLPQFSPQPNSENYGIEFYPMRIGGVELGSTAADEILHAFGVSPAACALINQELTGSTNIPQYTDVGAMNNYGEVIQRDGNFISNPAIAARDVNFAPGCHQDPGGSGWTVYFHPIRVN